MILQKTHKSLGLSLFKFNLTQHVQKYQLLTTSTPLPQDTYYPVLDMRTKEIHQYSPRLLQYGTELELKKNPNIKQMKNQGKEFIHQGIFRDFLVKQLKDDQEKIYTPKEILLVGRSNVGKSSLINNIFGIKDLSLVSRKTGSTQKLRQYEFKKNQGILIDSPGYGFSQINVQAQRRNQGLLLDYLKISTRCVRVFLLINAEHGIQVSDAAFLYRIKPFKLNVQVVLTKADKIKENQLLDRMLSIGMQLKQFSHVHPIIHATSCNDNFGILQLKAAIAESLLFYKQRKIPDEKYDEVIQYMEKNYRLKEQYLDRKCLEYYTKLKPQQKLLEIENKQKKTGTILLTTNNKQLQNKKSQKKIILK